MKLFCYELMDAANVNGNASVRTLFKEHMDELVTTLAYRTQMVGVYGGGGGAVCVGWCCVCEGVGVGGAGCRAWRGRHR